MLFILWFITHITTVLLSTIINSKCTILQLLCSMAYCGLSGNLTAVHDILSVGNEVLSSEWKIKNTFVILGDSCMQHKGKIMSRDRFMERFCTGGILEYFSLNSWIM